MNWFWRVLNFLFSWARKPLLWYVRQRVVPNDLSELGLDPNKPVCYVLPSRSQIDRWVLSDACKQHNLPRPKRSRKHLPTLERPGLLYLPALLDKEAKGKAGAVQRLLAAAIEDESFDLQVVPVSVFWGRDPGSETSLLRIIFSHSEQPGPLRKCLIVAANGRNTLLHFGKPLSFREFAADISQQEKISRKLIRVLRVHFRRERNAVLGPSLSRRNEVVKSILQQPGVVAAMERECRDNGISMEDARNQARKYGLEIAADYSASAISFLDHTLTWIWNRIFDGVNVSHIEKLRAVAPDQELIYMAAHRSHTDYLLLSYILYHHGLIPPHIAAGINLNFWPVGGLLRRSGAFYLRRTFSGNPLYTEVFRAYVDVLISRGYSISFYPEGGRSRTGRLLHPKTGMLSMVLQSQRRDPEKPVSIVPIYIGYDRVVGINSYFKELSGASKKSESAGELLKAGKILQQSFGKAYLSFGEPIQIGEYLNQHHPGWQTSDKAADAEEDWASQAVAGISSQVMTRINAASVASPSALVATVLLATPQKAISEDELIHQLDMLIALLKRQPYSETSVVLDMSGREIFEAAEKVTKLMRIPHEWGDLIRVEGREAVLLNYYRNNIQHLFAVPSLLACYFRREHSVEREALLEASAAHYPRLRRELFLRWAPEEFEQVASSLIDAMIDQGLLTEDQGRLSAPAIGTAEFSSLAGLGRILSETLERYCLTTLLLAQRPSHKPFDRKEFEAGCVRMAERLSVLTGRNSPDFFDKALFRGHVDTLIDEGLLTTDPEDKNALSVADAFADIAEQSLQLVGPDLRQTLEQLIAQPSQSPAASASK